MQNRSECVPPQVVCRYNADKDNGKLFSFVKDWCKDLTFGTMTVSEAHILEGKKWASQVWDWYTRGDLELKWHAWEWEEGKKMVETLITGAKKSKPNADPAHKKDVKMNQYRLLKSLAEGNTKSNTQSSGMHYSAELDPESARADTFLAVAKKRNKMICNVADPTNDDEEKAAKKARRTLPEGDVVPPTPKLPKPKKSKLADTAFNAARCTINALKTLLKEVENSKAAAHHKAATKTSCKEVLCKLELYLGRLDSCVVSGTEDDGVQNIINQYTDTMESADSEMSWINNALFPKKAVPKGKK
jgi:hypothetical protein